MKICIAGGGIIGLSCAYYLNLQGYEVTVIDKGNGTNNCSFGNAGYIATSHFMPIASPGIVSQGLKWMLSSSSPFYIKPRLDASLIRWGLKFRSMANEKQMQASSVHLCKILQLSRKLMIEMNTDLKDGFQLQQNGCFMMYQNEKTGHHEAELALEAKKYGIPAFVMSKDEIQKMEPDVEINALGGVYFPEDCHVNPVKMMESLYTALKDKGVKFLFENEVVDFEMNGSKVKSVVTDKTIIATDHIVIAVGSWLPILTKKLGLSLLLQAGKGYSITYSQVKKNFKHPAILVDDRVALTPLGEDIRIGGTMELSGINHSINMNRVRPIVAAANFTYPGIDLQIPKKEDVWSGLRPCSPDGLPYIGESKFHSNVAVAGGHAMIGISLAAATGKLISQMISKEKTEINIDAFRLDR